MMSISWTRSHTSQWRAMSLAEATLTLPGFTTAASEAFFIIREKKHPVYEVIDGEDALDGEDNVLRDQTIGFTKKQKEEKYPSKIRRIV